MGVIRVLKCITGYPDSRSFPKLVKSKSSNSIYLARSKDSFVLLVPGMNGTYCVGYVTSYIDFDDFNEDLILRNE